MTSYHSSFLAEQQNNATPILNDLKIDSAAFIAPNMFVSV